MKRAQAMGKIENIDLGPTGNAATCRLMEDAVYRGKVVGRRVVDHPLEIYYRSSDIDEAQERAGQRLRRAMERCGRPGWVVMRPMYVSEASGLDEQEEEQTDEEKHAEQARLWAEIQIARRELGALWPDVRRLVEGDMCRAPGALARAKVGLSLLAEFWKERR